MDINIDSIIFVGFLVLNLGIGLYFSKGTSTVREYAIGNRNFSTPTIAATIIATWVSGEYLFTHLAESYSNGLYFIWITVGNFIMLLLVALFFAPRMAEFLGHLSIAEAMGTLYGEHVRIITAIAGCIGTCGIIAVQLKISGLLFEYCFNVPGIYGIVIGGAIITLYSSCGGIKSVTFTDIIQLLTFGTIIPTLALFMVGSLANVENLTNTIVSHELFDYKSVFDFSQPKSFYYVFLFFYIAMPGFDPAIFQRIAMAKNTLQVRKAFIIAAIACLFLSLVMTWMGILVLFSHPGIAPNDVAKYIIFDYSYIGLKGLTLAGIMAMVMSTVDSYINSTSVLFVHDFCRPLKIKFTENELLSSRVASLAIGAIALLLASYSNNLLQMIIFTSSFYMPIVTVPFVLAILGFRSSPKAVLIGMGSGFITVLLWEAFLRTGFIDSVIPGMVANLVFLIGSHYFLKQPGGWVGIKDYSPLQRIRQERKITILNFINSIKDFNVHTFFRKNGLYTEAMYTYFGLFCIISVFSTLHTLPNEVRFQYPKITHFIYPSVLFISTILVSYPLWLASWKKTIAISVFWNIATFYVLVCVGFLLVVISNFAHLQLMAFMVNLIMIAVLVRWKWALVMIITGLLMTIQFFKFYIGVDYLQENYLSAEFATVYLLLLISTILIIFLKPKQEYQEVTEEQKRHLELMAQDREAELTKLQGLKNEFLRNLQHEVNTPLVGLTSLAPVLLDSFDKLPPEQIKKYVETIVASSERYGSLAKNLLNLSNLSSLTYRLNKTRINLSELVESRMDYCRKLYLGNKELEFVLDINHDVIIECDEHYVTSALDNLIINAIKYSSTGKITIKLHRKETAKVEFQIIDEGIGIPKAELHDIFGAFVVSSKTHTPSGGRGVGLALCKKIAEVHGGSIRANSDGEKGAAFILELPA